MDKLSFSWVLGTEHALIGHSRKNLLHNRARPDGAMTLLALGSGGHALA